MYPAESGVALEFTAAGLLRVLKATGKMGVDAVKEHAANLSENMAKMRRLGRGAMHGLPHAVEGLPELLHGRSLPPEWGEAIGKLHSQVTGEIGSRFVGIVKRDAETFHNLTAGVNMHLKGGSVAGELREANEVGRLSSPWDVSDDSSEAEYIARRIDPSAPEMKDLSTREKAITRFRSGLKDEEVVFFKTPQGEEGDFISAYRGRGRRINIDSPEERAAFRGSYAIHSHPEDVSFSDDDVEFMIDNDLRVLSAVSPNYEHVMRPGARLLEVQNAEPRPKNKLEFDQRRAAVKKVFREAYNKAKLNSDERMFGLWTEESANAHDIFEELLGPLDKYGRRDPKNEIVWYQRRKL